MSSISDARLDVAETLAAALPGLPVWAYPPNNMAAPCAFVQLGAGLEQPIAGKWNAELVVTLIGPGGDNDVAIVALEKMIMDAAQAISAAHLAPVTWQTPGVLTISGVPYFSARLTVPIDVEAMPPPPLYGADESIYPTRVPSGAINDDINYTFGLRYQVDAPGVIVAIRFWRTAGATTATRPLGIWDESGQKVAAAQTTAETGEGWVTTLLAEPLHVDAGQVLTVGYTYLFTATDTFSIEDGALPPSETANITPLSAVFAGIADTFPNTIVSNRHYLADIVYRAAL